MLDAITQQLTTILGGLNYFEIAVLMAIESSFLPLPSELILPPAGYLVATGQLSMLWVIVASTVGSLIGATFNYFLAYYLGRRVLHRLARSSWAKWFLIDEQKLIDAEEYYKNKGKLSTFIGRLLPIVRHLISLPAGLAKMNLGHFWLFTALGATVWSLVLVLLGYWFGANQALIATYYHQIWYGGLAVLGFIIIYLIAKHVHHQSK